MLTIKTHLNMKRTTCFLRAIISTSCFPIRTVVLPNHTRPCGMTHPQQNSRSIIPHLAIPCFKNSPMAFVINQLCFPTEIIQVIRRSQFTIHPFLIKLTKSLTTISMIMPVVIIPNITNGPCILFRHKLTNSFSRRQRRSTHFGSESSGQRTIVPACIKLITPRSAS